MFGKLVKPGSYIGRTYRIKAELGTGGSGAVYMAWHTRLCKYVVIKIVKESSVKAIEVHRNEVEALKNIKNMHIPLVLDFIVENDHSFTVMEFIDGGSFDKLLDSKQQFTEKQVLKWYIQLASALDVIHKNDVCHRDIKPSNILYTTKGDVCLIDFNSALVSWNNTGIVSRSMGYASPEQYEYFKMCRSTFNNSSEDFPDYIETELLISDCKTEPAFSCYQLSVGAQSINWKLSDIYSLGATMYHFMTKKRPPVKEDEIRKIPKINGHSKGLLKIIEKSMRKTPHHRFSSAEELLNTLQDLI